MPGERSADFSASRAGDTVRAGVGILAVAMLAIVGLLVFLAVQATYGIVALSNDGAQYLSAIRNFLAGNGVSTSTLYYDVQLGSPTPAPLLTWPPGFPLLAAAVSALGSASALVRQLVSAHRPPASRVSCSTRWSPSRLRRCPFLCRLRRIDAFGDVLGSKTSGLQRFPLRVVHRAPRQHLASPPTRTPIGKMHAWPGCWALHLPVPRSPYLLPRRHLISCRSFFAQACLYCSTRGCSQQIVQSRVAFSPCPCRAPRPSRHATSCSRGVLTGGAVTDRGTPLDEVAASVASISPHYRQLPQSR